MALKKKEGKPQSSVSELKPWPSYIEVKLTVTISIFEKSKLLILNQT